MAYLSAVVVVALVLVSVVTAEKGTFCAKNVVVKSLDIEKLAGLWVERASHNTDTFVEKGDTCHFSHFYVRPDKKHIDVLEEYTLENGNNKKTFYTIVDKDAKPDGNLVTKLNIIANSLGLKEVEYDVMATDYDQYLFALICHDDEDDAKDFKAPILLFRDVNEKLEESDNTEIKKAITANGLDKINLEVDEVSDCKVPEFPATFSSEGAEAA